MNPLTQSKRTTILPLLIALVLACFGLSPAARAQLPSPAPDGGYPNANTAEGNGALLSLTTGSHNTAMGFHALYSSTEGTDNTAVGYQALYSMTGSTFEQADTQNTAIGSQALYSNTKGFQNTAT